MAKGTWVNIEPRTVSPIRCGAFLLSHGVLLLTPAHCHLALLGLLRTRRSGDVPLQLAQHVRRLKPGRVQLARRARRRRSGDLPLQLAQHVRRLKPGRVQPLARFRSRRFATTGKG